MSRTAVERKSDRELVVTRTFNAPAHIVFEAWSKPELFKRWWVPKSVGMSLLSCDMDVRTGGAYRFVFSHPAFDQPMAFFGTYSEVTPNKRLVWTNEESDQGAGKPLILLHGGINPDSFGSNLAELAKGRQVIAVHLQAHGRTPDTDRPLRCETMGDDVAALIGHLKLGKADVMGYSLGSFVALQTAIRHPDAVDRLRPMAARIQPDDAYPEVVAAFNQLEANAAMLR